ncbi:hypothetical protein Smp_181410.1 [Schistosoma mansoni]|uniref:SERTA domain-containing protein n=1 Tax=Schistosoma mansoni TaxID=6183 RepID=G4VEP3_SCHMA|nr:hypothetical protein Smp_181410.1 [Schistosoma mansoni]|eukprot:XP_018651013.1 hypothetical protein Smp_181410.1 [Schistosoma mansoni]
MLRLGGQTENSSHIRENLKAETPLLSNARRKLGLRDLNIQQHVHVQPEIKRPSKTLVPESIYEEACEKFCAYEDRDDYGDLCTRLDNINSLVDGVLSLSCMSHPPGFVGFSINEDCDEFDPSDFEIPDSEFNTMFSCLG